jgi:predicted acyltransferase
MKYAKSGGETTMRPGIVAPLDVTARMSSAALPSLGGVSLPRDVPGSLDDPWPKAAPQAVTGPIAATAGRFASLDLLRGATVAAMIFVNHPGDWEHVYRPFTHAAWNGFTPTDLIFPAFLFMVGVAGVFSMERRRAAGVAPLRLAAQALARGLTIAALGWWIAGFPFSSESLAHLRIPGVLPRIGIVFIIGSLLLLAMPERRRLPLFLVSLVALLLAAHTFLLTGLGYDLTREGNIQLAVDRALLQGHAWLDGGDPEGIVSTISATATMLTGALAGWLLLARISTARKVGWLLAAGGLGILAGVVWNVALPINKHLWTGSFVLLTSGATAALLAVSMLLADVLRWQAVLAPFHTFGTNPLAAFVLSELAGKTMQLAEWHGPGGMIVSSRLLLLQGGFGWIPDPTLASHGFALAMVSLCYLALRALEARGWYLKV